jgi:hypothetical protein
MHEHVVTPELAARARRHFVEGAAIIAEYERIAGTIDDREQIAEAGRFLAAAHDVLRDFGRAHGDVVDLRSLESDASERLDD